MTNNYTKAAFTVSMLSAEAELIGKIIAATAIVSDRRYSLDDLEEAYASYGREFAAMFPREGISPFGSFVRIFYDPDYPDLCCDIDIGPVDDEGRVELFFRGEQFETSTVATILQMAAPSILPFGFEYAVDCDRLAPEQFGGGFVCITAQDISFGHSSMLLDAALGAAPRDGARLVIAVRNSEWGLRFWNDQTGFDSLRVASTYTVEQAENYDLPIADDQPEWLELPA